MMSRLVYISLVMIPFCASFSSRAVNACILIALLAFCAKRATSREFGTLRKNPLLLPFLAFLLVALASFINSVSLKASAQGVRKWVMYLALVLVLSEEVKDAQQVKRIVAATLFGLFLASLDGLYQLYTGFDFIRRHTVTIHDHEVARTVQFNLPRLTAAFHHTNMFGIFLGLFLPLGVSVALYAFQGRWKWFSLVTSSVALFCLLSTFSRGAFAGLLVALIFLGIMKKDRVLLGAVTLMLGILPFVLPQSIKEWQKTTPTVWESLLNTRRIGDWRNALNMIRHHPFLGVGLNTYTLNFEKYKLKDASRFVSDTGWSHNGYLQLASEVGLVGLSVFLWILFRLFRSGFKAYREQEGEFLKTVTLGILAGLFAFLVNAMTETSFSYSKMAPLFWFQAGFLLALGKVKLQ